MSSTDTLNNDQWSTQNLTEAQQRNAEAERLINEGRERQGALAQITREREGRLLQ